jgi:hypothetical protein
MYETSCLMLTETGMEVNLWLQLSVVGGQACTMIPGFGKVRRLQISTERNKSCANYFAVTRRMGFLLRELGSAFEAHTPLA